jgi:hypothetical protein
MIISDNLFIICLILAFGLGFIFDMIIVDKTK